MFDVDDAGGEVYPTFLHISNLIPFLCLTIKPQDVFQSMIVAMTI